MAEVVQLTHPQLSLFRLIVLADVKMLIGLNFIAWRSAVATPMSTAHCVVSFAIAPPRMFFLRA